MGVRYPWKCCSLFGDWRRHAVHQYSGAGGDLADQFHHQRRRWAAFFAEQAQLQHGGPLHAYFECRPGDSQSRRQHGSAASGLWLVQSKGIERNENPDCSYCFCCGDLAAFGNGCGPCRTTPGEGTRPGDACAGLYVKRARRQTGELARFSRTMGGFVFLSQGLHERLHQGSAQFPTRSEEHTSELQSRLHLVCRLLLEKKKNISITCSDVHPDAMNYVHHLASISRSLL